MESQLLLGAIICAALGSDDYQTRNQSYNWLANRPIASMAAFHGIRSRDVEIRRRCQSLVNQNWAPLLAASLRPQRGWPWLWIEDAELGGTWCGPCEQWVKQAEKQGWNRTSGEYKDTEYPAWNHATFLYCIDMIRWGYSLEEMRRQLDRMEQAELDFRRRRNGD